MIDPTAVVHRSAVVDGAAIGARTVVGPHAYLAPNVAVGQDCVIGPGACLGQDGFGYAPGPHGRWHRKPQSFGVVVGDDVHVGANACVDRGSYRPTAIGRGTRIDNLVHIAHNAQVGEDCLIIAGAMVAGSATIGDGAYLAPHSCVREHIDIGEGAFVALGAVVIDHVGAGARVRGVPAKSFHGDAARLPPGAARSHVAP